MLRVDDVRFVPAFLDERQSGLLGWVSFTMGGTIRVDGVAVRRRLDGTTYLSFPTRRDRHGREHHYLAPLTREARADFEAAILAQIPDEMLA